MLKKIIASIIVLTGLMPVGAIAQTSSTRSSFESGMISSIRISEEKQTTSIRTAGVMSFLTSSIRVSE